MTTRQQSRLIARKAKLKRLRNLLKTVPLPEYIAMMAPLWQATRPVGPYSTFSHPGEEVN